MQVEPYLNFNGRCEEAVEFYGRALGAEVTCLHRFKDCPDSQMRSPEIENKVMHAALRIGNTTVMASDGQCERGQSFQGFSMALTVPNDAEAERFFAALSDGGQVEMPLTKTFFSSSFAMLTDRFGVRWMIHTAS